MFLTAQRCLIHSMSPIKNILQDTALFLHWLYHPEGYAVPFNSKVAAFRKYAPGDIFVEKSAVRLHCK